MSNVSAKRSGFTIIELIIVIAVIIILLAIVMVSYVGIQERARNLRRENDIRFALRVLEAYRAEVGEYPKTTNKAKADWHATDVLTDANCVNGSSQYDWIPGTGTSLPQSESNQTGGAEGQIGCYLYASNGNEYVLSAWNMLSNPQTATLYRRLGFRDFQTSTSTQFYTCNKNTVGGLTGGGYNADNDYYKHSYTFSNIADCDETPPPGA